MMISFVIPAHNEEDDLGATLDSLIGPAEAIDETYEVIVVADGCTDKTAAVARTHGARVLEVDLRHIAADFFTVEVWTTLGLVRYLVFCVLDRPARRVEIAGIAPVPDGMWMEQVARNSTDVFSGFLRRKMHLIHDHDSRFTKAFFGILRRGGVQSVRLPAKSPNLNAYADERQPLYSRRYEVSGRDRS